LLFFLPQLLLHAHQAISFPIWIKKFHRQSNAPSPLRTLISVYQNFDLRFTWNDALKKHCVSVLAQRSSQNVNCGKGWTLEAAARQDVM
jgi:hypothetical protein